MKTLDLEQMGVKELNKVETKKTDGGDGILDSLLAGVKWNLRAMSWGLYQLSK